MAAANEVIPARSTSLSPLRCLNRPSSRQMNRGSASSKRDRGSSPSFRAREKRSSTFAEGDISASSLHHVGHAASIAGSASPKFFSRRLSCFAVSFKLNAYPFPLDGRRPLDAVIIFAIADAWASEPSQISPNASTTFCRP